MQEQNMFLKPVSGMWDVTIEGQGGGQFNVDGCGEPLEIVISNLDIMCLRQKIIETSPGNPPYEIISFDEAGKKVVVRRKG
jgi:hypothetical protein